MRKYTISKTGLTIIVNENSYDDLGLPVSLKTGLIRPAEGADMGKIVAALESGKVQYKFAQLGQNGIYEMERVSVAVPAGTLETA